MEKTFYYINDKGVLTLESFTGNDRPVLGVRCTINLDNMDEVNELLDRRGAQGFDPEELLFLKAEKSIMGLYSIRRPNYGNNTGDGDAD